MSGLNRYQKFVIESILKSNISSKSMSSDNLSWYEEIADVSSHLGLLNLWVDAEYIPEVAPALELDEYYIKKYNNFDVNILQRRRAVLSYVEGSLATYYSEDLKDAIDPLFGEGYLFDLRDSSDTKIPLGLNRWIADCNAGTISFLNGFPEGYDLPLTVTFYKYVGRKGTTSLISTSGQVEMIEGYMPTLENQVATKKYVDTNTSELSDLLSKLKPHLPPTFENTDLEIISPHRKARLCLSTDPEVDVIYDNTELILKPKIFYNNGFGEVALIINDNVVYTKSMEKLATDYNDHIFQLNGIVDPYADDGIADEVYTSIDMTVNIGIGTLILPHILQLSRSPYVDIKLRYTDRHTEFYTNTLTLGVDTEIIVGSIRNAELTKYNISNSYISGVPAIIAGEGAIFNCDYVYMNRFRKDTFGTIAIDGIGEEPLLSNSYYNDYSEVHKLNLSFVLQSGVYTEKMKFSTYIYNLDGKEIQQKEWIWPFRIDSVSDESIRVTSPDEKWQNYGKEWDDYKKRENLIYSNELQLLNGKFQWPRGNYLGNGITPDFDVGGNIKSGPNYNLVSKEGIRYATFKRTLEQLSNGFYFNFVNPEAITYDEDTFVYNNISILKCRVENDDNEYSTPEWLNMLEPYNGVLNPEETLSLGCHVINKSNGFKNYYTFGQSLKKGILYITVGIPYNMEIKFADIQIS